MNPYDLPDLGRTLFEESGDALFLFDPETEQLLDANPMAQRLGGFTRADLLGFCVPDLFRSEAPGGLDRLQLAYRNTGLFYSQDGFLLRHAREGVWVPVNLTITRLHTDGRTLGLVAARDVTERKAAEDALRASEQRHRLLFERNLAGVFRSTADGRILDCNDSFARIFGYASRADAMAHAATALYFDPAEREAFVARVRARGLLANEELRMRRRDGTTVWVLENVGLRQDPDGSSYLEGTLIDITERKRAEEALRASETKYRCLVENLEQGIFLKDTASRFVAVNGQVARALGRAEAEIIGKTDFDILPPHTAARHRAEDLGVLADGQRLEKEKQVTAPDGKAVTLRTVKTAVRDEHGQPAGVLGIVWDVTEQRLLEAQLRQAQKMDAVGQLAGGVAHDFNNLLTAILGNLAFLLTGLSADDPRREMAEAAEKAAQRAATLTGQLLGFSRQPLIHPLPTNLNSTVDEVVRLLRRIIDPRIALVLEQAADLGTVLADPSQLSQVVMNLCLNARDAMPEGGRLVLETANVVVDEEYARRHLEARPGLYVRLRVGDSGGGMAPEVRARIFEPFFTTKGPGKGTGLGLAMVFGIVKRHHGWVECTSALGQGSRFDVYLPRAADAEAPAVPSYRSPESGRETILLADDEPLLRNLGRTILRHYGYEVLLAEDGQEAVDLYHRERGRIDLVILDLTMPRLSGRDAFRRLLELDPQVRVLFASGYSPEYVSTADHERSLGFVAKPYRPEVLAECVRAALDWRPGRGSPGARCI
jgi:PAS domain S-box-containing protein